MSRKSRIGNLVEYGQWKQKISHENWTVKNHCYEDANTIQPRNCVCKTRNMPPGCHENWYKLFEVKEMVKCFMCILKVTKVKVVLLVARVCHRCLGKASVQVLKEWLK